MMIKLLGGALTILSAGLLGISMANRFSGRPRELRRLRAALQLLETEIIFASSPLPAACSKLATKLDKTWAGFFYCIYDNLRNGGFYTVSSAWNDAIEQFRQDIPLGVSDFELLEGFGHVLGLSDKTDQKKHFDLFYLQLAQHEAAAEEERKKSEKMYRSLGFLVGIALFVVLI